MKWFKHMTGTFDDEKIARYVELCGLEGYGFFWRIIELIAAQVEKDNEKCDVTYSLPTLSRLCYSHHNKVGKLLVTLGVTGLMTISKSEVAGVVSFSIKCPNVLKYRDEWTARKQKTPEQLPSNSRVTPELNRTDKDKDKDKEHITPIIFPDVFSNPEFQKTWDEWKRHRKEKRKPLTLMGEQKSLEQLVPFGVVWATKRINQAIAAGWQGLVFKEDVPPKEEKKESIEEYMKREFGEQSFRKD